jgi:hypothetical protein
MRFRLSFGPARSCFGVEEYHQGEVIEVKEISGQLRLVFGAIGLGLIFFLAVAAMLNPSPFLVGTHQQLGLPPCTFLVFFGVPCPTCGMTTAWAFLMHGDLLRALQANAGGALLAALAVVAAPWLMLTAVRGRWLGWKPNDTFVACASTVIIVISLVQWVFRLLGHNFHIF